jgi:hypothetical protein
MPFGLQTLIGVLSIGGGMYAAYDFLFGPRRTAKSRASDVAGGIIFVILMTIGIDEVFFGQNAVLQVGYILQLPLLAVQIGFIAALLLASYAWTRS